MSPMLLKPQQLWSSLLQVLAVLPPTTTKREYFEILAAWTRQNLESFGEDAVQRYGLDWLATLDGNSYAIDAADITVSEEATILLRQHPTRLDTIAMFVRDQLWPLVAFQSGTLCPNCGEDDLRVLQDTAAGESIVFACDQCGWAQHEDGSPADVRGSARPATSKQLRALGYLVTVITP